MDITKTKPKKKPNLYVDPEKFGVEIDKYVASHKEATEKGETPPRASEYIGKCFFDISTGLSKRYNFRNYPFVEEMVADGVMDCVRYAHRFDRNNPKANLFNYFTQICFYAFIRRIQREKKYLYTKYKAIDNSEVFGLLNDSQDELGKGFLNDIGYNEAAREKMNEFIETYEAKETKDAETREEKAKLKEKSAEDIGKE